MIVKELTSPSPRADCCSNTRVLPWKREARFRPQKGFRGTRARRSPLPLRSSQNNPSRLKKRHRTNSTGWAEYRGKVTHVYAASPLYVHSHKKTTPHRSPSFPLFSSLPHRVRLQGEDHHPRKDDSGVSARHNVAVGCRGVGAWCSVAAFSPRAFFWCVRRLLVDRAARQERVVCGAA